MNDNELLDMAALQQNIENKNANKLANDGIFNKIILKTMFSRTDHGLNKPNNVILKDSEIHGKGVFASKDIKQGELITYYPAHYVLANIEDNEVLVPGEQVKSRGLKFNRTIKESYSAELTRYYYVCGDPRLKNKTAFLGHMCNDGATHNCMENDDDAEDEYDKNVGRYCNAIIKKKPLMPDLSVRVVSLKNIKEGEEILVPYGFNYWKCHNILNLVRKEGYPDIDSYMRHPGNKNYILRTISVPE